MQKRRGKEEDKVKKVLKHHTFTVRTDDAPSLRYGVWNL